MTTRPVIPPTIHHQLSLSISSSPLSDPFDDIDIDDIYNGYHDNTDDEAIALEPRVSRRKWSDHRLVKQPSTLTLSLPIMSDQVNYLDPRKASSHVHPSAAERQAETLKQHAPTTMDVSPRLDPVSVSMYSAVTPIIHQGGQLESTSMLLPPPANSITIHPSSSVSSRYSVGTFGPGHDSSTSRYSRSTDGTGTSSSDAGTLRSSRRRRPISMASVFDAQYSPSLGSSPPATARASSVHRPSISPDEDEFAAIQTMLLEMSEKNPTRIVPATRPGEAARKGKGEVVSPIRVNEFGAIGESDRKPLEDLPEPPSPIDPLIIPNTPTRLPHPQPFSPMSPGESISSSRRHNSLDSLNPSIADSLLDLLPQGAAPADFSYAFRANRNVIVRQGKPAPAGPIPLSSPTSGLTRNALSPEQRTVLLRRTRKAEQVLGEQLCETDVERHIIYPVYTQRTVLSRISDQSEASFVSHGTGGEEPKSIQPQARDREEDCASAAIRAFEAFGFGQKQLPSDLRSYARKESMAAENSGLRGGTAEDRRDDLSFIDDTVPLDERRHRRAQLAKLHKILGVPVPAGVITSTPSPVPSDTSSQLPTYEISFLDFGDEDSMTWTQRVKSAMTGKREARTSPPKIIMSTLRTTPPSASRRGSDNASPARQRSTSEADIMINTPTPEKVQDREAPYDMYAHSLKSLMYLVEHDQASLANIMDTIENEAFPPHHPFRTSLVERSSPVSPSSGTGSSSAPASPMASTHPSTAFRTVRLSPTMLRARNDKLARFFGEADIDFTSPPPNFHISDLEADGRRCSNSSDGPKSPRRPRMRQRTTTDRLKKRMEVFDGLLGEMWSAVQKDAKGGAIRQDERDRLGDMMGDLRRRSTMGMCSTTRGI